MPSSLFGKIKNFMPVRKIRRELQKAAEDDAAKFFKRRYEEITAPLDTEFTFEIVELENDDTVSYQVRPVETMIQRTTGTGGEVSSTILFNTLDQGSENAKLVILPDDFENETSPNSTSTGSADYERSNIFVNSNYPGKDMEARNWSVLIAEEYSQHPLRNLRSKVGTLARNALGLGS
jgi:hypothetical protein